METNLGKKIHEAFGDIKSNIAKILTVHPTYCNRIEKLITNNTKSSKGYIAWSLINGQTPIIETWHSKPNLHAKCEFLRGDTEANGDFLREMQSNMQIPWSNLRTAIYDVIRSGNISQAELANRYDLHFKDSKGKHANLAISGILHCMLDENLIEKCGKKGTSPIYKIGKQSEPIIEPFVCRKGNSSEGESRVAHFLDDRGISYTFQKKFPTCKDKRPLPFDFIVDDLCLAIEVDGDQHRRRIEFFHRDDAAFTTLQAHDAIKDKFVEEELCYHMLRVNPSDKDQMLLQIKDVIDEIQQA